MAVPVCSKEDIAESKDQDVFNHLLSEVVIDTEKLLFLPVWLEGSLQFSGASQVLAERLLDLQVVSVFP
jgi:hypothetical protein